MRMRLGWLKDLLEPDRRAEKRHRLPGIVAHYWNGEAARARDVLNISMSGSYLLTEERWYPDTVLKITLKNGVEPESTEAENETRSISILAKVVRSGPDGVGLQFIFPAGRHNPLARSYPDGISDRNALRRFLERTQNESGEVFFSIE